MAVLETLVSQMAQGLLASTAYAAWRAGWHWPRLVLVGLLAGWLVGMRWRAGRPAASVLFRGASRARVQQEQGSFHWQRGARSS